MSISSIPKATSKDLGQSIAKDLRRNHKFSKVEDLSGVEKEKILPTSLEDIDVSRITASEPSITIQIGQEKPADQRSTPDVSPKQASGRSTPDASPKSQIAPGRSSPDAVPLVNAADAAPVMVSQVVHSSDAKPQVVAPVHFRSLSISQRRERAIESRPEKEQDVEKLNQSKISEIHKQSLLAQPAPLSWELSKDTKATVQKHMQQQAELSIKNRQDDIRSGKVKLIPPSLLPKPKPFSFGKASGEMEAAIKGFEGMSRLQIRKLAFSKS